MQSTAYFVAPTEMSTNVQFLLDCLNETGVSESFESQAETAPRVAELSAFTIMQQSRRMLQRPLSIAGVEVADGNRFFVNLGSQAETCARPLVINDAMFKGIQSPIRQNITQPQTEEGKMPTAAIETIATPHAWDFRSKGQGSEIGVDRRWDWPALDEGSVRIPAPIAPVVWSKEPSRTRIPSLARKRAAAADAESLRQLLNTAITRETQRIEVRSTAAVCKATKSESLAKRFFDSVVSATRSLKTKFKAA